MGWLGKARVRVGMDCPIEFSEQLSWSLSRESLSLTGGWTSPLSRDAFLGERRFGRGLGLVLPDDRELWCCFCECSLSLCFSLCSLSLCLLFRSSSLPPLLVSLCPFLPYSLSWMRSDSCPTSAAPRSSPMVCRRSCICPYLRSSSGFTSFFTSAGRASDPLLVVSFFGGDFSLMRESV